MKIPQHSCEGCPLSAWLVRTLEGVRDYYQSGANQGEGRYCVDITPKAGRTIQYKYTNLYTIVVFIMYAHEKNLEL